LGGGDDVAGMSTAGFAGLVAGEDWHYVGEAGEPAFLNSWDNFADLNYHLAFRIRESGIVDVQGAVTGGANQDPIFQLPEGYRPSGFTAVFGTGQASSSTTQVPVRFIATGTGSSYVQPIWQSGVALEHIL